MFLYYDFSGISGGAGKSTPFSRKVWFVALLAGAALLFWVLSGGEATRTVALVVPVEKTVVVDGRTLVPRQRPDDERGSHLYHVQLSPGAHQVEIGDGMDARVHEVTVREEGDLQMFRMVDGELRDLSRPGGRSGS